MVELLSTILVVQLCVDRLLPYDETFVSLKFDLVGRGGVVPGVFGGVGVLRGAVRIVPLVVVKDDFSVVFRTADWLLLLV